MSLPNHFHFNPFLSSYPPQSPPLLSAPILDDIYLKDSLICLNIIWVSAFWMCGRTKPQGIQNKTKKHHPKKVVLSFLLRVCGLHTQPNKITALKPLLSPYPASKHAKWRYLTVPALVISMAAN